MKPQIILLAITAFAAACNESIKASPLAIDIRDVSITSEGSLAALLVADANRPASITGSVHTVTVIQGSAETVQKKLDAMIQENPYNRPIKLLVTPEADFTTSKKKSKGQVILIVGTYQP